MEITHSATILLTKDIITATEYYESKLGFKAALFEDPPSFAVLSHGDARLMLAQVEPGTDVVPNWTLRHKTSNAYFWINHIHDVYESLKQQGALIDFALYLAPWGVWEFGIQDLDGHDITFGQIVGVS